MDDSPCQDSICGLASGGKVNFVRTEDQKLIRFCVWSKGTKGLVIFLNGRSEYIEKYNLTYINLQKRGFGVVSLDWRGQGLSERSCVNNKIGHVKNFYEYQLDLNAVINHPSVSKILGPRFLIAHSTGGCIGLRAIISKNLKVSAAIFLAPLWTGTTAQKLTARLSFLLTAVGLSTVPISPISKKPYILSTTLETNCLTSDKSEFARLQKIARLDPRLTLGPPSFGWIKAAASEIQELQGAFPLKIPCKILIGSKDTVISVNGLKKLFQKENTKKLIILKNAKHELLIEKESIKLEVWKHIDTMLSANTSLKS